MMGMGYRQLGDPFYGTGFGGGLNGQRQGYDPFNTGVATQIEALRRQEALMAQQHATARNAAMAKQATAKDIASGDDLVIEGEFTVVSEGGSIANSSGEEGGSVQATRANEDHSSNSNR